MSQKSEKMLIERKETSEYKVVSLARGFLHSLVFTNLFNNDESFGDRIMNYTMGEKSPVDNPPYFATGFLSGLAFEGSLIVYSLYELFDDNPYVLLGNAMIKTIPRGLEFIINRIFTSK
ncbi:hypothetical protein HYV50_04955 [Candidatus Pacearchaeota archaeon]|nr:hypothetical protein [Candidatus Pacearchaeota archaeon]